MEAPRGLTGSRRETPLRPGHPPASRVRLDCGETPRANLRRRSGNVKPRHEAGSRQTVQKALARHARLGKTRNLRHRSRLGDVIRRPSWHPRLPICPSRKCVAGIFPIGASRKTITSSMAQQELRMVSPELAANPEMLVAFHRERLVSTLVDMAQSRIAPVFLPATHMGDRPPLQKGR